MPGTPVATEGFAVNWLLENCRWGWMMLTTVMFVAAECAAVYYLYKLLGWM